MILLFVIIAELQWMFFELMRAYICSGVVAYILRMVKLRRRSAKDDSPESKTVRAE